MTVILNHLGAAHAEQLIESGNYDDSSPWSFSAEDGDKLLGPSGNDWATFGKFHLGEDTSATANTKDRYKYPFGKDGKVFGAALRAIRSRSSQQNDTAIFDEAGRLLDLLTKKKGGTADSGRSSSVVGATYPAYDPDGDGDNDAEEAAGLLASARLLLDQACGCLTGTDADAGMAGARAARRPASIVQFNGAAAKAVLRVQAQADNSAEIDFFGVVGGNFWDGSGITKEQFADELKNLPAGCTDVTLRMSSPGGDVFDGRAIANMIAQHPANFTANIIAEASSAASIIAMACDSIHMAEGSIMLVHQCYTFTIGNADDLEKLAADLRTIDDEAVATYAKRTGMAPAAVLALMKENRYMNAAECKAKGFCDTIAAASTKQLAGLGIAAMNVDRKRLKLPPLPAAMEPSAPRAAALAALQRIRLAA